MTIEGLQAHGTISHLPGLSAGPEGSVHRSVYVDPAVYDAEMERIFERSWIYVGHESEVPEAGDYKLTRIGRQPAIMARHRDGAVRVLLNRCMHRGALVCVEECGNTSAFKCIYHGWTYDTAGTLLGVPYPKGYGANFDKKELSLRSVARTASHRGFVFASMSPDGNSLADHLGPAAEYLDLLSDQSVTGMLDVRRKCGRYLVGANWKLQAENVVDGYHPRFTHETAFGVIKDRTGRNPGMASSEQSAARSIGFSNGHAALDYSGAGRGYSTVDDPEALEYRSTLERGLGPERAREALGADLQLFLFPNFFIQTGRQHIRVIRPLSPTETEVLVYPYAIPGTGESATSAQLAAVAWWASPAAFGQPEDIEALGRCQQGLVAGDVEWVRFDRGIDRETRGAQGDVIGNVTDEVPQRAIHAGWRRLMEVELGDHEGA